MYENAEVTPSNADQTERVSRGVIAIMLKEEMQIVLTVRRSWSFLSVGIPPYPHLECASPIPRTRVLHIEMYRNQPSAQYISEMVKHIRVSDAVDRRVSRDREQEDIGKEGVARLDAGDHATGAEGFD